MTRDELISICIDAVVHHSKWNDRDSYLAQKSIQSIYKGLTAGLDFIVLKSDNCQEGISNENTIIIEFIQPIDFDKLLNASYLEISSLEDYHNDCDPNYETEMFYGEGIDFRSTYTQSYMPTRKRLNDCGIGNDWY